MRITIVGAGNMGSALAKQLSPIHTITLYDRNPKKMGGEKSLKEAMRGTEILFLAVKPQNVEELAKELYPLIEPTTKVVSLLAGTSLQRLKRLFPNRTLVRIMPNLCIIHGKGVVAITKEDEIEKEKLANLLQPLGKIVWLPEDEMDSFTSLAASGPALLLSLLESIVDAGVTMGFNREESHQIVEQMVEGTLTLLKKSGKSEKELIQGIASVGGTTRAGFQAMEQELVRENIIKFFLAAKMRAIELQKG